MERKSKKRNEEREFMRLNNLLPPDNPEPPKLKIDKPSKPEPEPIKVEDL
jgi:hypothetical protein